MKNLNCKNYDSFYWFVILVSVIFSGFLFPKSIKAQEETDLSKSLPRYLGFYTRNTYGKNPQELEEFKSFVIEEFSNQDIDNPEIDKNGKTFIDGELETTNGTIYKFEKAFLKARKSGEYEYFEFKTVMVEDVSYDFTGKFLEREVQEVKGGSYTKVRGVLSKYKNGEKLACAEISFAEYATH